MKWFETDYLVYGYTHYCLLHHDINIINLDAQEETSRILIVVEDKSNNVRDAIRAIHARRSKIHDSVVKQYG